MARHEGPDAARRRQLAGRGRANPDKQLSLPVHQIALVVNGVHLLENLKLDELAQKQVYEFAFMMQPLKIQGGSGSTVSPIAVRQAIHSALIPAQAGILAKCWMPASRA